jgi:hypothetical protein
MGDYVMMTTLVSSINVGMDPRQLTQPMQLKANERTAAEELKAEEQQQTESVSTPKIKVVKSSMDLRMLQIHQAADAGILRPVWLEMLEMDQNMPRTSDMIRRAVESKKDGNAERAAEETERAEKAELAADGAERTENYKRPAEGSGRDMKSERSAEGSERTDKAERTSEASTPAVNSFE